MAELALAVTGVALAWKGILDFGHLVTKLIDDDLRQRDVLAIKLELSQYMLKDWGQHWGVDRSDGRFHTFETSRKELIMKIIFRLRDSRCDAMKRLRDSYGMLAGDEENSEAEDPGNGLARLADRVRGAARRGKHKARWLIHDRELMTELVDETMDLHKCLNSLTFLSINFLTSNLATLRTAQPLESGLARLESRVKRENASSHQDATQLRKARTPELGRGVDEQTLAGYASNLIGSSRQADSVRRHIDRGFHYHGDARVPETIATWWGDASSGILMIEVSDDADDATSTYACVLLYYLVACRKLIYVFEPEPTKGPAEQLLEMLRALIQGLVSLRGNQPLGKISFPASITEIESGRVEAETIQRLITLVHDLVRDMLTSCDQPILLVIDGLELVTPSDDESSNRLVRSFVSGLRTICDANGDERQHILKILLGHKGHATTLYDCVGDRDVADLTGRAARTTSMRHELAVSLRE
ncbi:hypothetical protein BU26DRAFT_522464 [Trematosphaeria pertusa]|uniref:Prion-inhibition and propagation HeLo domain-containing protein n=1 Tax=Trematosphaeria pertusa TaxID=390896 RepID=A0A6A6I3Z5_9PLEO|nr:uncharacterized protein BU26DRAFT_522464 [Trematosphaeria pertusa]KAF2244662.1 hypothetical protein BU26DRAFT_522464 [Trematosphaeria pertusa]